MLDRTGGIHLQNGAQIENFLPSSFFKPRQTQNAVPGFAGSCQHSPRMESTGRNSRMRIAFFASTYHQMESAYDISRPSSATNVNR